MAKLILLRHGESEWNKLNLFTGWEDVGLSEKGIEEAKRAGQILLQKGILPDICFTSLLKRAVRTLNYVLEETDLEWLPVVKTVMLNERHYGILQGLNKAETAIKYGEEQVRIWRRSYDVRPPALNEDDPRNPRYQTRIIRTRFKAANLRSYCVKCLDNMFNITCGICLVSTKICRLETAGHPQAMIFNACLCEASADNIIIFSSENH